jgi:hypothetical protein
MQKQQTSGTLHSAVFLKKKGFKKKQMSKIITVELPHDALTERDDENQQLKHSITMSSAVFWDDSDNMSQSSMLNVC